MSSAPRLDAVVLDAALRQSLVTVRSLGRAGLRVGVFEAGKPAPAFASRWCTTTGIVTDVADDPDLFIAEVFDIVDRHRPAVLLVAHDGTIEALRTCREELETRVALALGPEHALDIAVSKTKTLALATELGIRIPRGVLVDSTDGLRDALAEVGLPVVIKPVMSWVEREGVRQRVASELAVTAVEARAAVEAFVDAGASVVLQQWLPGRREAVWLMYAEGRFCARFAQVAHRMLPLLGGSSVVRESIPLSPQLVDDAERLVAGAGLSGYSEVEFRRDADGRPVLMEINPRLSASVEVAVRSGVDFPLLLYLWAAGLPLDQVRTYREGVRMRWLAGDVWWLRETLRAQGRPDSVPSRDAVKTFLADCLRPQHYDYLALSDPRPAMVASRSFLTTLTKSAKAKHTRSRAH